jgi:hypothetical protein
LCATYPFISNELFDENGVLVGANDVDKSLIMIDLILKNTKIQTCV